MLDIRERRSNSDGSVVYLIYQGIEKDKNNDNSEAKDKIRDYLNKPHLCRKIKRSISILRTILKDYDEVYLYLKYEDDEVDKCILYQDKELTAFEKKYKKSKNSIKYNQRKNVHFDMHDKDLMEKEEFEQISKGFNELRNIGPFEINDTCKKLIEIYRLFFGIDPVFTETTISEKMQCMMYFLKEYGIVFPEFSDLSDHKGMPISLNLERLVYRLYPYATVRDVYEEEFLDEKQKKIISIVGKKVCEATQMYRDRTEALIQICRMMEEEKQGIKKKKKKEDKNMQEQIKESVKTLKMINVNIEE